MISYFRTPTLALWLCAMIWGVGFVPQKMAMAYIDPLLFNALRSALPVGALGLLICVRRSLSTSKSRLFTPSELRVGAVLGILLWLALSAQQVGIVHTLVYRASLITGIYIIFVPFVTFLLFSMPIASWQLSVVGLACLGLFLLITNSQGLDVGVGDLWILLGAVFWAVHVGVVARNKKQGRVLQLSFMQMAICAVLSAVSSMLLHESWRMSDIIAAQWFLLYAGLISGCVAFTLQIYGQRAVTPLMAAIILSFEAVFGACLGWWFLDEPFSLRNLMGAGFIMLAITLVHVTSYVQWRIEMRAKSGRQERL